MAYARIVVKKTGTVLRTMKMDGWSTGTVDSIATTLESIISEDLDILEVQVDYEDCNDSLTIENYRP